MRHAQGPTFYSSSPDPKSEGNQCLDLHVRSGEVNRAHSVVQGCRVASWTRHAPVCAAVGGPDFNLHGSQRDTNSAPVSHLNAYLFCSGLAHVARYPPQAIPQPPDKPLISQQGSIEFPLVGEYPIGRSNIFHQPYRQKKHEIEGELHVVADRLAQCHCREQYQIRKDLLAGRGLHDYQPLRVITALLIAWMTDPSRSCTSEIVGLDRM